MGFYTNKKNSVSSTGKNLSVPGDITVFGNSFLNTSKTVPTLMMVCGYSSYSTGAGARGQILKTTDGITWQASTLTSSRAWSAISYGNGIFVVIGGGNAISNSESYRSTDTITWTVFTLPVASNYRDLIFINGNFVIATGTNSVYRSTDSVTWTQVVTPSTVTGFIANGFDNTLLAVGDNTNTVSISSNGGATWTSTTTLPTNWHSGAYGKNTYVIVSRTDRIFATSTNTTTWTVGTMPGTLTGFQAGYSSIVYGNGIFVAVNGAASGNNTNQYVWSSSGTSWTLSTLPLTAGWRTIGYVNNTFITTTNSNAATSTNGISWTLRTMSSQYFTAFPGAYNARAFPTYQTISHDYSIVAKLPKITASSFNPNRYDDSVDGDIWLTYTP